MIVQPSHEFVNAPWGSGHLFIVGVTVVLAVVVFLTGGGVSVALVEVDIGQCGSMGLTVVFFTLLQQPDGFEQLLNDEPKGQQSLHAPLHPNSHVQAVCEAAVANKAARITKTRAC